MLKKIGCITAGITLCLMMAGCQVGTQQGYNAPYNSASLSTQDYVQLANIATGTQKEHYRLLAAGRALDNHQVKRAKSIANVINAELLPTNSQNQLSLTHAQIDIIQRQYDKALNTLTQLSQSTDLDFAQQRQLHQLTAESYSKKGNLLAAIEQYDALFPLTDNDQNRKQIAKTVWHSLQNQSETTLQSLEKQSPDITTTGWLQLASISKQNSLTPPQFLQALNEWQQNFPGHPGQTLINTKTSTNNAIAQLPQKIALLLPLTGSLAKEGRAIQNGFFGAYYAMQKQGFNPSIRVYNTNNKNITSVYQQAKNNGADFVVGPLTKSNVKKLVSSGAVSLPTLALNRTDNTIQKNSLLYEFGLSPLDEMQQSVSRIWADRHYRVLIIAPNSQWSQRIVNTFQQQWASLGGHVVGTVLYQKRKNLSHQIRDALNINQTEARRLKLRRLLRQHLRFLPRRRKDFDAIFIITDNYFARQIVPLLKFYFAGNVPTYSMPSIYPGNSDARRDHDLNNVIFNHMPWDLQTDQNLTPTLRNLRAEAKTVWPTSYKNHKRLMALGVDAYLLIPKLGKLTLLPQFGIAGATGTLYLLPNHHIYRKLDWAQFKNGRAKSLS